MVFFFFKQKTAYEMRISDWSSDVCSSDLHDGIILGGGLTGMTLALSLYAHGVNCAVIDPIDPGKAVAPCFDCRVSAISSSIYRLLSAIGLDQHLEGNGCPIRKIWVSDGLSPGTLDFAPGEDDDPLGIMFENRELRLALAAASREAKSLALHIPARPAHVEWNEDQVRVSLEEIGRAHTSELQSLMRISYAVFCLKKKKHKNKIKQQHST